MQSKELISSPFNYTGGKYRLLKQILPYFPDDINGAVDLFCGGCSVGINIECNSVVFCDINPFLIGLLNTLKRDSIDHVMEFLDSKIYEYGLSDTSKNGYAFYGCDSSSGLASYNKEPFTRLKKDFNSMYPNNADYFLYLYLLIVYSFNNQLRFNSKKEFNLPVGKRDFNLNIRKKLRSFMAGIKNQECTFLCRDFRVIDTDTFGSDSFFYIDPPYLITTAGYNEQSAWNEKDEISLLSFLDALHEQKIRFALSNVLESRNKENTILKNWLDANTDKYKVIALDYSYSNSNYHIKDRAAVTKEILVLNY